MWMLFYLGLPDVLFDFQGSAYVAEQMMHNLEAAGIRLLEAPIEIPETIGHVDIYDSLFRESYERI